MKNINPIYLMLFGFILIISFFLDNIAFQFIDKIKNPFFDFVMPLLSNPFFIIGVLILITVFFFFQKKNKLILTLWLSFLISWIFSYILKFTIARQRLVEDFIFNLPDYSFPSTHAVIAFSLFPILNREFPKFKWFLLLFVSLVAFSRIYLKAHYLSDVVAGALLGYAVGFYTIKFVQNKRFRQLKHIPRFW